MDDLKPCPFCGGDPVTDFMEGFSYMIECQECDSTGPRKDTEAEAIAAWNTRAAHRKLLVVPPQVLVVPPEWKAMPVASSEAMREAFASKLSGAAASFFNWDDWDELYAALLAAAPLAPARQPGAPSSSQLVSMARDWQAMALREAAELSGAAEGAARLVESRRYGMLADALAQPAVAAPVWEMHGHGIEPTRAKRPGSGRAASRFIEAGGDRHLVCEDLFLVFSRLQREKAELLAAARNVIEWTEAAHRPPVRDSMEVGRTAAVRLHALADLAGAIARTESNGLNAEPVATAENSVLPTQNRVRPPGCQQALREAGQPYPRTCAACGLGPCKGSA